MLIVSLDIETTGLNPKLCQILEFGAVLFDTSVIRRVDEMPHLHLLIDNMTINWEQWARRTNLPILDEIQHNNPPLGARIIEPEMLTISIKGWLQHNKWTDYNPKTNILMMNVAGKNVGFDIDFLELMPYWRQYLQTRHRLIDPAQHFVDLSNDIMMPNLDACVHRANIKPRIFHRALDDAKIVVELLQVAWGLHPDNPDIKE